MPDTLGLIVYLSGILSIMISAYFLNSIILRYLKKETYYKYFYLFVIFMVIFIMFRLYLFFYIKYLTNLNLNQEILTEKLLFMRMFSHIPLAISVTILLFMCYTFFIEIKTKLAKPS